jgi:hypothetical protein
VVVTSAFLTPEVAETHAPVQRMARYMENDEIIALLEPLTPPA